MRTDMKQALVLAVAVLAAALLSACGSGGSSSDSSAQDQTSATDPATTTPAPGPTATPVTDPAPATTSPAPAPATPVPAATPAAPDSSPAVKTADFVGLWIYGEYQEPSAPAGLNTVRLSLDLDATGRGFTGTVWPQVGDQMALSTISGPYAVGASMVFRVSEPEGAPWTSIGVVIDWMASTPALLIVTISGAGLSEPVRIAMTRLVY